MKHLFFALFILLSCTKDEVEFENKVLLLKLDFVTYAFEEGIELNFDACQTFTIKSTYTQPSDFGSVNLSYEELNAPLFDGSIVWMGTGSRNYPGTMTPNSGFTTTTNAMVQPDDTRFMQVDYVNDTIVQRTDDNTVIWNSIKNLELTQQYLSTNPSAKIYVFNYTPSVGVGDPNEWDYYIFIKN
jgi:hypothetical protein